MCFSLLCPQLFDKGALAFSCPEWKYTGCSFCLSCKPYRRTLSRQRHTGRAELWGLCSANSSIWHSPKLPSPFLQQLFSSILPGSLGDSSLDICLNHLFSRHRGQTFPLYSCPVLLFWCSDEHTGEVGTNKNTRQGSYKDFLSHLRWARLTKINPLLLTGVPT